MVKVANKKLKTPKKPTTPTLKKKPRKTKKKKPISKKPIITSSDSDSDSDSQQTTLDRIEKLIEPYSKSQLIDFIISAAISNPSFYTRIRNYADTDVSHRKIFVYGLGWDTTKENLVKGFKPYGEIEDCNVVIDRNTGKAKGFGFVQFKLRKSALKALRNPKKRIGNRMVSCQLASLGPGKGDGKGGVGNRDNWDRKIYVSNVRPDTDPGKLRVFFERFGEIETGPLGFDSSTGKSRGFALFVYKNQVGLKKALEEPKKVFEGHQLHCQKASGGGKNKGDGGSGSSSGSGSGSGLGVGPILQQPDPQMMAAVAASQNFGLYPMYGGFIAANAIYPPGVLGQMGGVPGGLGGYYAGAPVPHGLGIGVDTASLLGATPPMMQGLGLQNAYPMKKAGPGSGSGSGSPSGSRSQGAGGGGGSYSRYSSHKRLTMPNSPGAIESPDTLEYTTEYPDPRFHPTEEDDSSEESYDFDEKVAQGFMATFPEFVAQLTEAVIHKVRQTEDAVRLDASTGKDNGSKGKRKNQSKNQSGKSKSGKKQRQVRNLDKAIPEQKGYIGPHPRCNKCSFHHLGDCLACHGCKLPGHKIKYCKKTNVKDGRKIMACYECGSQDHLRNLCPRLGKAPIYNESCHTASHPDKPLNDVIIKVEPPNKPLNDVIIKAEPL